VLRKPKHAEYEAILAANGMAPEAGLFCFSSPPAPPCRPRHPCHPCRPRRRAASP
jgi:hypothetical protein